MTTSIADRYELTTLLARGGQSEVWWAQDRVEDRAVALKLLAEHLIEHPTQPARLLRETEVLRRLRHPAIVTLLDAGIEGRRAWLVTEHLPGGSAQAMVARRGPLRQARAVAVVRQVASGLAVAHAAGVIHRDIKPSNILFDGHGQPRLADFGCSLVPEDTRLTLTDHLLGSLRYMAPEQRLDSHRVDERADVFGLGATMLHLLTGRTQRDPFTWPQRPEVLRGVRPPMAAVIGRALAYEREERWPDVRSFADAIGEAATDPSLGTGTGSEPEADRQPTPGASAGPRRSRP